MRREDRDLALLWDMRGFAREAHEFMKQITFELLTDACMTQPAQWFLR